MKVNFPILKLVPAEAGMGYKNEDCFDHGGRCNRCPVYCVSTGRSFACQDGGMYEGNGVTGKTGYAGYGTIPAWHRIQRGRKRSVFMEKSQGVGTMQSADIMEVKREELPDIDTIQIDKMQPIEKKLEKYVSGKEGDLSTHLNEGYVVRVHFSMENYSATDALKQYLKQIAELKY